MGAHDMEGFQATSFLTETNCSAASQYGRFVFKMLFLAVKEKREKLG